MYGVPENLKALRDFEGLRLVAVDDLENIVYFRFSHEPSTGELEIGVESTWELRAFSGEVVAKGAPGFEPGVFGSLLQSSVVRTETRPPQSIVLQFASGHTLEIFDNSDQYESFSIPHGNVYI
jgi:hypothetical protein